MKKHILFIFKSDGIGGVEVVNAVLANKFVCEGHDVSIFSFLRKEKNIVDRLDKRIKFYYGNGFKCSFFNKKMLSTIIEEREIDLVLNEWGLSLIPIFLLNGIKGKKNFSIVSIHHNAPNANGRLKNVEQKLSVAKNPFQRFWLRGKYFFVRSITAMSMRYNYRHCDYYQVLSSAYIDVFKQFTGLKDKRQKLLVQTNPVTISNEGFDYDFNKKQKEIVYVGRLDNVQKCVGRIVDVWSKLESQFQDWNLTIVGGGEDEIFLKEKAKRLNLKRISFEGYQYPKSYYERASALLLTSDFEGFPLVLAECMSFGVIPFVYDSFAALHDIVKDGENGVIFPKVNNEFSVENAVNKIIPILSDETLLQQMALSAVETSKEYSVDSIYHQWNLLFKKLK